MQGKKVYQEQLFNSFRLSDRVPSTNFYRLLREALNLDFLYGLARDFYGDSGQKSIDPVVFFKLCLVGYLENIISDRQLIDHCSLRLDILYFLGYDIDEELPWHSTISRTCQLFPEDVFEEVFTKVFRMCVDAGMVSGHTQAIDSAPIKANASIDSSELKVPREELEAHLHQIRHISKRDKETPLRRSKNNKADKTDRTVTASDKELQSIKSRNRKWAAEQDQRPGAGNKGSRYTSNKTHYSPTDPDARISVKPGKARKLNYLGQLTVDTSNHVITDIKAYHADGKDNQQLPDIVKRVKQRLWKSGLLWENCVADTGYSSGENYAMLEDRGVKSFIPPHGTYKKLANIKFSLYLDFFSYFKYQKQASRKEGILKITNTFGVSIIIIYTNNFKSSSIGFYFFSTKVNTLMQKSFSRCVLETETIAYQNIKLSGLCNFHTQYSFC